MKEIRRIDNMKVRNICIKDNYYTRGTNKDYSHLLFDLCKNENVTLDDLKEIATDILFHSDWERKARECGFGYDDLLLNLMSILINEACFSIVEP